MSLYGMIKDTETNMPANHINSFKPNIIMYMC